MIVVFNACTVKDEMDPKSSKAQNYLILIDLSDRLLAVNQAEQDIAVVKSVFKRFTDDVSKKLFVNSNDKFAVHLLFQEKPLLNYDSLNNQLLIDLSSLPIQNRKRAFEKFAKQLDTLLQEVYSQAGRGKSHVDYQGVDIWRYFNESLQYSLLENADNHLIILTDGYFDFESGKRSYYRKKNRFASSVFYNKLSGTNWMELAEEKDYGLIPVKKPFAKTNVMVAGINPKTELLTEVDKLTYFWDKWLNEMNFNNHIILPKTNKRQWELVLPKTIY
jgi:hypothetical protein